MYECYSFCDKTGFMSKQFLATFFNVKNSRFVPFWYQVIDFENLIHLKQYSYTTSLYGACIRDINISFPTAFTISRMPYIYVVE